MLTLGHYLIVSGLLFTIGFAGVLLRRNIIIIFMSLELMLNAANLSLVAFSRFRLNAAGIPNYNAQVFVFFIITVSAAEVAVGLALIGALIHIYSLGYMKDDGGKSRYFASLSFFMFSMLGIVLSNNFVMMFIFWELVGLSSYLLIGHWFERDAAAEAAKKAFITNRIGDFGFMLGILMIWAATGSVIFSDIVPQMGRVAGNPAFLTISVLLIF